MSHQNLSGMLFSVVIPTHCRPVTLVRAIQSCWNQTFTEPFEVIVVNDGGQVLTDLNSGRQAYAQLVTLCIPQSGVSAARNAGLKALDLGMEKIEVVIKGRGNGRETSVRALKSTGLNILSIEDRTSVPHNGCRPPKKRRL